MNEFKVSRKSWHYKFMSWGRSEYWLEDNVTNFCSYWGEFILKIVLCAMSAVVLAMLSTVIIVAVVNAPLVTFIYAVAVVVIWAIILGISWGLVEGTSLIKYRIETKGKYCSRVEYTD